MADKDRALHAKDDDRAASLQRLRQVVMERSKVRPRQTPAKAVSKGMLKSVDGSGRSKR